MDGHRVTAETLNFGIDTILKNDGKSGNTFLFFIFI